MDSQYNKTINFSPESKFCITEFGNCFEGKDESPTCFKKIQVWSDGDTRKLLDLYAEYLPEIGPLKKFRTKKDMWITIATNFHEKTPKQCEERYKTVLRRKKIAVDNNKTSGSQRMHINFEEELNKICILDDSIEPEVQMSSSKCVKVMKLENPKSNKTKSKSVQETLLEIAKSKEEGRERRHKEKMDLLKKLFEDRNI